MSTPAGDRLPLLIAMAGLPGSGKSTCASLIARQLRLPVIDKDDVLEIVRNSAVDDDLEQARLAYDVVFALVSRQLVNGVGVVVDTCLAYRWLRTELAAVATHHGARMLVVHCVCDDETARARVSARMADGFPHRNVSEYGRLRQVFERFETPPDLTIDTSGERTAIATHLSHALAGAPFQAPRAPTTAT